MRKGKEIDLLLAIRAKARSAVLASYPTDTVSGSPANFPDGADGIPVVDLKVSIQPVQTGSGDPGPSNVRPISGWTGANVYASAALVVTPKENSSWIGTTARIDTSGLNVRRTYLVDTTNFYFSNTTALSSWLAQYENLPAGKYVFTGTVNSTKPVGDVIVILQDANGANEIQVTMNGSAVDIPAGYSINRVEHNRVAFSTGGFTEIDRFVVAPVADVKSISWQSEAGTVYGGTLDVTTGELTVDRGIVDLGTLTWTFDTLSSVFISPDFGDERTYPYKPSTPICSNYLGVTPAISNNGAHSKGNLTCCFRSGTLDRFYVRDDSYNDADTFTNAMSGVQLVYELATPVTYQLTPRTVKTLLGENNIWADTGDVEVEYRADLEKYIEKKIGEADAGTLSLGSSPSVIRPGTGLEMQDYPMDAPGSDWSGRLYPEDEPWEDMTEEELTDEPEEDAEEEPEPEEDAEEEETDDAAE